MHCARALLVAKDATRLSTAPSKTNGTKGGESGSSTKDGRMTVFFLFIEKNLSIR